MLARAELWKDAEAAIKQTTGIDPASAAHWNAAVRSQAVAESTGRDIPRRFLYRLYYGVKLTRFRGQAMIGAKGVHSAEVTPTVSTGVPAAHR